MTKKGTNMKPNTVVPLRWFVMLCAIWYHFTFLKTWNTPMEECHLWTHEHLDTHGHFLNCLNGLNWNIFFSTQRQCCLTFSWIELQMLLRSCLIHMSIIILRHVLYWLYLHPCLELGPFMLYCDLLFFFIFIFIMINLIVSWILVLLLYYFWMITWMKNVNNFQKASNLLAFLTVSAWRCL